MNVPETPFVLHPPNVMHLATDVTGVLADGASSLALAEALHPSAAVCGTLTAIADQVIADLEGMDRRRYAGPVGWIDASGDGEWGIACAPGRWTRRSVAHAPLRRVRDRCRLRSGGRGRRIRRQTRPDARRPDATPPRRGRRPDPSGR